LQVIGMVLLSNNQDISPKLISAACRVETIQSKIQLQQRDGLGLARVGEGYCYMEEYSCKTFMEESTLR